MLVFFFRFEVEKDLLPSRSTAVCFHASARSVPYFFFHASLWKKIKCSSRRKSFPNCQANVAHSTSIQRMLHTQDPVERMWHTIGSGPHVGPGFRVKHIKPPRCSSFARPRSSQRETILFSETSLLFIREKRLAKDKTVSRGKNDFGKRRSPGFVNLKKNTFIESVEHVLERFLIACIWVQGHLRRT